MVITKLAHKVERGDMLHVLGGPTDVRTVEVWARGVRIRFGEYGVMFVATGEMVEIVVPDAEPRDFEREWSERNEVIEFDCRTYEELGLDTAPWDGENHL